VTIFCISWAHNAKGFPLQKLSTDFLGPTKLFLSEMDASEVRQLNLYEECPVVRLHSQNDLAFMSSSIFIFFSCFFQRNMPPKRQVCGAVSYVNMGAWIHDNKLVTLWLLMIVSECLPSLRRDRVSVQIGLTCALSTLAFTWSQTVQYQKSFEFFLPCWTRKETEELWLKQLGQVGSKNLSIHKL